ncbi:MAG: hypothetical protein WC069_04725 [Candidatus Shapirobacteria bacterium]
MSKFDQFLTYFLKTITIVSGIVVVVAIIPTFAIITTWNTIPGQKLYPLKRNIEISALKLLTGNFSMTADLQSQILDRRFAESQVLLAQDSGYGLATLTQQIQAAKVEIITAKSTNDPKLVQKKAENLVVQLKEYNQKLETTKTQITSSQSVVVRTPTPIVASTVISEPTSIVTKPEESKAINITENIAMVSQTQEEIKVAIVELEKVVVKEKEREKEREKEQEGKDVNKSQDNKEKKDKQDKKDK